MIHTCQVFVMALTATATLNVEDTILDLLLVLAG